MVTGRSMQAADGSPERLRRRLVDVIDVVTSFLAGEPGGATATAPIECHDLVRIKSDRRAE